eukprot:m.49304 g.49304  ORF g.49304 m.49304 type:complete len:629 (+) comp11087_c0_seq4:291-2177(+)
MEGEQKRKSRKQRSLFRPRASIHEDQDNDETSSQASSAAASAAGSVTHLPRSERGKSLEHGSSMSTSFDLHPDFSEEDHETLAHPVSKTSTRQRGGTGSGTSGLGRLSRGLDSFIGHLGDLVQRGDGANAETNGDGRETRDRDGATEKGRWFWKKQGKDSSKRASRTDASILDEQEEDDWESEQSSTDTESSGASDGEELHATQERLLVERNAIKQKKEEYERKLEKASSLVTTMEQAGETGKALRQIQRKIKKYKKRIKEARRQLEDNRASQERARRTSSTRIARVVGTFLPGGRGSPAPRRRQPKGLTSASSAFLEESEMGSEDDSGTKPSVAHTETSTPQSKALSRQKTFTGNDKEDGSSSAATSSSQATTRRGDTSHDPASASSASTPSRLLPDTSLRSWIAKQGARVQRVVKKDKHKSSTPDDDAVTVSDIPVTAFPTEQLDSVAEQVAQNASSITTATRELSHVQEIVDDAQLSLAALKERLTLVQEETKTLKASLESQATRVKSHLGDATNQIAAYKQTSADIQHRCKELDTTVSTMQTVHEQRMQSFAQYEAGLRRNLEEADAAVKAIQSYNEGSLGARLIAFWAELHTLLAKNTPILIVMGLFVIVMLGLLARLGFLWS